MSSHILFYFPTPDPLISVRSQIYAIHHQTFSSQLRGIGSISSSVNLSISSFPLKISISDALVIHAVLYHSLWPKYRRKKITKTM